MTLVNLAWMLTALAAVVVLLTRSRLLASERQAGVAESPHALLHAHSLVGVAAIAAWVAWLSGADRVLGIAALVLWWVLVLVGLLILGRWLPAGGRHATAAHDDDWAHGPGLSVLGHVGMLAGVVFFTWFFLADKL